MLAVQFLGQDRISLDEVPRPEPQGRNVMVRRGLPVERIVTHRVPLAESGAAFALFRAAECGKIVFAA